MEVIWLKLTEIYHCQQQKLSGDTRTQSNIKVSGNKVGDRSNQGIANGWGKTEGATATVEVSNNEAGTQSSQHIANASEPERKRP